MEIPTSLTQRKVAELLHDIGCADKPTTHEWDEKDKCLDWPQYVTDSALFLAQLMKPISTEMFPAVRADEREKAAFYITAELVCCDIHARMEAEAAKGHWDEAKHQYEMPKSWKELKKSSDYHAICRYGGWAASLAFDGPSWDGRFEGWSKPWEVWAGPPAHKYRCTASGGQDACQPVYWCPVGGEYESPCHGGFDTCCSKPNLHRPKRERE